ncbi:hypothetical protein [Herbaspirillum robiniae]|uniref:hypothetical protein n=1 Tax=Herbaspirillum robiniae TaxID=2014887 RepID=UPI0011E4D446|nr:hypothetical protein [Herbaspirillum robiniae]
MRYEQLDAVGTIRLHGGTASFSHSFDLDRLSEADVFIARTGTAYTTEAQFGSFFKPAEATPEWKLVVAKRQRENGLIHQAITNVKAGTDAVALSKTMELVLTFISENGPEYFYLRDFEPSEIQPEHLAAVLATTVGWKDQIKGWDAALAVTKQALINAKLDPEDVLFGLI